MSVDSMKEKLGANAIPVQCPIGAEGEFKGMVDLVSMKGYLFLDETMGAKYETRQKFLPILKNYVRKCAHATFRRTRNNR